MYPSDISKADPLYSKAQSQNQRTDKETAPVVCLPGRVLQVAVVTAGFCRKLPIRADVINLVFAAETLD